MFASQGPSSFLVIEIVLFHLFTMFIELGLRVRRIFAWTALLVCRR